MDSETIRASSQQQFDRQSHHYGATHILADTSDVDALLDRIPEAPGRALDVACGAGHTARCLAARGWRVAVSDLSQEMLDRTREQFEASGLELAGTRQHPAEQFPYEAASFELVSCRVAAHHFACPASFVMEAQRCLTPGGYLLVIDGSVPDEQPEAEEWIHAVERLRDPSHNRFIAPERWKRLCREANLEIVQCALHPFKQPDLEWYFQTAGTTEENRRSVRRLIDEAPKSARDVFRLGREEDRIVWWWPRLSLLARKPPERP